MKLLKRIIEAAFLMASIMLLASDNVWCWIASVIPFCSLPSADRCMGRGCVRRVVFEVR